MATQFLTDPTELYGCDQTAGHDTIFDNDSNQIASVSPLGIYNTIIRDIASRVIGNQNGLSYIYSSVLDAAGRTIATVSPMGFRSSVHQALLARRYRSNSVLSGPSAPNGYIRDAASQQIAAINPMGGCVTRVWAANGQLIATQNELSALTSFVLDAASQRICVVDANNGRSTVGWDIRGLKSYEQSQLGELTSFSHDPNSNTILRVDARNPYGPDGWPTSYTIDALNRTAQTQYIDNTHLTGPFAFRCCTLASRSARRKTSWQAILLHGASAPNAYIWDAAGQQIVSADVTGITSTVWDLDSRKTAVQNPTGVNLTSTLDVLGNRLVLADPWGLTTNSWDIQSRLIETMSPPGPVPVGTPYVSMTYDALDREVARFNGSLGTTVSHTFDADGRETALANNFFMAPNFLNYYDGNDNRIGVVESTGGSVSYSYDAAMQLINEKRTGTDAINTTYTLDLLGNRLLQNANGIISTRTFNAANAQLTLTPATGAPTTSSYDSNGNLVLEDTGGSLVSMTWDPENRMSSYTSAANAETYLYSEDGYRKKKTTSSGTTLFTWDEQNCFIETDASLNLQARRTDFPGYWGGLSFQDIDGYVNIPLFDSQGTTRFALWFISNTYFGSAYILDAFGNLLSALPTQPNPMQFVGQFGCYTDATGLIYVRNRIYDPVNGRFISRDRIGFGGGWNPYGYGDNNPTTEYDPTGQAPEFVGCKGADIMKLNDLFSKMCAPLNDVNNPNWPKAQKCATDCDACPTYGNSRGTISYNHFANISDCMKGCYQGFCGNWGRVQCVYGDCTKQCGSRSAACVPSGYRGTCSRFQGGNTGEINPNLRTIILCMDRAFPGGGKWNSANYGCTGGPYNIPNEYYPDCKQGCTGSEDVFYMLHELQHICGDVNDSGQNECRANQQACCILNSLYPAKVQ